MPLIDLKKSSNTVALVESFLGEIKPDDEGTPEPTLPDKTNLKIMVKENENKPIDDSQPPNETLIINSPFSLKLENEVSNEIKANHQDTTDVCVPVVKSENVAKETIEESIVPIVKRAPSPPPPPPVKRKVS